MLGRNARERREQRVADFEKTQREYVQEQRKRKLYKKKKREQPRVSRLEKRR